MNAGDKPRKPYGLGTYLLVVLGVGAIGAVVGGVAGAFGDTPGPAGLLITVASITLAMALAFAACVWWWRGIDEAAREAHKWAWWWGGSSGMAIGIILFTILTLRGEDMVPAEIGVGAPDLLGAGAWTILLFQLAGYSVAWAVWWLKHR